MPPVIAAVAVAAIAVGVGAMTFAAAAAFVTLATMSYLLTPRPEIPELGLSAPELRVTMLDPAAPRRLVYGRTRVAGVVVFMATNNPGQAGPDAGIKDRTLHLAIAFAGHEVEAIDAVYFNDELAVDAAGVVQGRFAGWTLATRHLGAADQLADQGLIDAGVGWTAAHQLRGIAYVYLKLTRNPDVFGSVPNVTALIRGKKVFDPRTSLTAWSDNAALCIADYLADPLYGLGAPYGTEIDAAALIAAANICDELVQIPDGLGGQTTERRYTANGVLSSAEEPKRNLERLLSALAGRLVYTGGTWVLHAGAFELPTLTLDEDDLRGRLQVQPRLPRRDLANAVRGLFVGEKTQWQPADFPPVVSDVFRDQDGGERIWRDVEWPFTATETMAQRLAKVELFATREQITATVPVGLRALALRAGDTVALTNTRLGWVAKPFLVTDWQFVVQPDDQGAPLLGVLLQVRETSTAVYDTTAAEQQLLAAAPDSTLPDPFTVAPPTSLALASGTPQLYLRKDGTIFSRLQVSWVAPTDQFVLEGGRIEIQAKRSADPTWLPHPSVPGDVTTTFLLDVQDGVAYDVRIRSVNAIGAVSVWVSSLNHVVIGKGQPPAAPTAISVRQRAAAAVEVTVTAAPPVDWGTTELWRNTINDAGSASLIDSGKRLTFTDQSAPIGATVYYFARLVDTSGNAGGFSPATNNGLTVVLIQTEDLEPDSATASASAAVDASIAIAASPTWTTLVSVVVNVPAEGAEFYVWAGAEIVGGTDVEFRLVRDTTVLVSGSAKHGGAYTIAQQDIDTIETAAFDPAAFDPAAFATVAAPTTPTYTLEARNPAAGAPVAQFRRLIVLDRKR